MAALKILILEQKKASSSMFKKIKIVLPLLELFRIDVDGGGAGSCLV